MIEMFPFRLSTDFFSSHDQRHRPSVHSSQNIPSLFRKIQIFLVRALGLLILLPKSPERSVVITAFYLNRVIKTGTDFKMRAPFQEQFTCVGGFGNCKESGKKVERFLGWPSIRFTPLHARIEQLHSKVNVFRNFFFRAAVILILIQYTSDVRIDCCNRGKLLIGVRQQLVQHVCRFPKIIRGLNSRIGINERQVSFFDAIKQVRAASETSFHLTKRFPP
mmetsp:Transcript_2292/g.6451  ORF Transcript_2292/g.6451 Transcript_2292/m.6451 type:complete len:220 (-) Transcript_2292:1782-2441(-)